jgi:hypothetical protein
VCIYCGPSLGKWRFYGSKYDLQTVERPPQSHLCLPNLDIASTVGPQLLETPHFSCPIQANNLTSRCCFSFPKTTTGKPRKLVTRPLRNPSTPPLRYLLISLEFRWYPSTIFPGYLWPSPRPLAAHHRSSTRNGVLRSMVCPIP